MKKHKLIAVLIILLLSSCNTKRQVITEMDGDRQINWYSDE
jgi:hypothetical protein